MSKQLQTQSFLTLNDLDANGRTVLVRVDFNVPMQDGQVADTTRIERALSTLNALSEQGAKVVMMAHFGRPKGERKTEFSLKQILTALSNALNANVRFAEDCIGEAATSVINEANSGDYILLENLRFYKGEEANDPDFAKALAELGDIYVNDAFSAAHRAHASTVGIANHLPAYAGHLMAAELTALAHGLEDPKRPVVAVVGGAKVSTKLDLLNNLVKKVDMLVLGGGMANTFLYALGTDVAASLCEKNMADQANEIRVTAEQSGCKLILPEDAVVAREFAANAATQTVSVRTIPEDTMILDIGPATAKTITRELQQAQTILWNGPMGAFEIPPFHEGTNTVARAVADMTDDGKITSVAGGGDTVSALAKANVLEKFSYVSTAGGAFLEWLEGKTLPGVAALNIEADNQHKTVA